MTPQELKNSILQLAIQGKLVEQRPEEGTAAELLEKIARHGTHKTAGTHGTKSRAAHRASFVSSVSSVSDVPVVSPIPDDEKPFDIPESWEWVRLGEIAEVQLGKMLDKGKNKGTPYPYLANLSVRWRSFDLSALRMMPFTESECEKFALLPGDVLMCEGGVPGRCAAWMEKNSPVKYQKAIHRIRSKILGSLEGLSNRDAGRVAGVDRPFLRRNQKSDPQVEGCKTSSPHRPGQGRTLGGLKRLIKHLGLPQGAR